MNPNEHDIGIGKPTSQIPATNVLEAIEKTQQERARIITELGKAQINEKRKELTERLEETNKEITTLIGKLPIEMKDMIQTN